MSSNVHLAWFVLLIMGIVSLLTYLAVRAGQGYSVEDTQAHAETFGGVVQEGHGGTPAIALVVISTIIIWAIIYLIMHWRQFAVVFFR